MLPRSRVEVWRFAGRQWSEGLLSVLQRRKGNPESYHLSHCLCKHVASLVAVCVILHLGISVQSQRTLPVQK